MLTANLSTIVIYYYYLFIYLYMLTIVILYYYLLLCYLLLLLYFFLYTNYYMTIKQYIQNKDVKLKLFDWALATKDTEQYRIYNALLDDFLSDKDVAKLKFKPKILFMWHLYCGALQSFVLTNDKEKLDKIVKKCPLSKRELETLFS